MGSSMATGLNPGKRQANLQKRVLLFLVCTSCLQLIFLLSLTTYWRTERSKCVIPVEGQQCHTLKQNNLNKENGETSKLYITTAAAETFCGRTSEVFKRITDKIVEERYDSEANPEANSASLEYSSRCQGFNRSSDAVQLTAIASYAIPERGKPTKIYWVKSSVQEGSVPYNSSRVESDGIIQIKRSGLYFVSSRLSVAVENGTYDPSYTIEGTHFRHYLMHISYEKRKEKVLLENALSKCHMLAAESEKTSNIEAVFKLEEGDSVFVATSHSHKIICAPLKNSFNIYSL